MAHSPHGHLQADDVPRAGARCAVMTPQRIQGCADLAACVHVVVGQGVGRLAWQADSTDFDMPSKAALRNRARK